MTNDTLDEISFRNIVLFYKDELIRLMNGEKYMKIFKGKGYRLGLYRKGVITFEGNGAHGNHANISERALKILKEVIENE